jgi:hypothetical protein
MSDPYGGSLVLETEEEGEAEEWEDEEEEWAPDPEPEVPFAVPLVLARAAFLTGAFLVTAFFFVGAALPFFAAAAAFVPFFFAAAVAVTFFVTPAALVRGPGGEGALSWICSEKREGGLEMVDGLVFL